MLRIHRIAIFLGFLSFLLSAHELGARSFDNGDPSRSLDDLIRSYAYKALIRPRTGVIYPAQLPRNITGIEASVVRVRSGSFAKRGVRSFHEFEVPSGLKQSPLVVRIALVYQNLGNWSSVYYPLPGYQFLSPVLGLLAYDATDLALKNPREVEIVAVRRPISIKFRNLSSIPSGHTAKCIGFYVNDSYHLADLINGSVCEASKLGHFAVIVNSSSESAPPLKPPFAPGPIGGFGRSRFNRTWRIAAIVVGGLVGVLLLVAMLLWLRKLRRREKMGDMVKRSEGGEVLKSQKVGSAHLPIASMVRTRPVLENEYPAQIGSSSSSTV